MDIRETLTAVTAAINEAHGPTRPDRRPARRPVIDAPPDTVTYSGEMFVPAPWIATPGEGIMSWSVTLHNPDTGQTFHRIDRRWLAGPGHPRWRHPDWNRRTTIVDEG
jgi:hypothetical protein